MKLLPLSAKKKLSQFMNWFGFEALLLIVAGGLFGGMGSLVGYEKLGGDKKEAIVLQQKVDHTMESWRLSQSMHTIVVEAGKGAKLGIDTAQTTESDKVLADAFNAEAKETGMALAFARHLTPQQRHDLYKPLLDITPLPDYIRSAKGGTESFVLFNHTQSAVMNRPGFTPTIEAAREIAQGPQWPDAIVLIALFGVPTLGIAGAFGFCAVRRRLDNSIEIEEKAIRAAEQAVKAAEAKVEREKKAAEAARVAEEAAKAAARAAAEAAERERIANLPVAVATALENDVSVHPIKLIKPEGGPK